MSGLEGFEEGLDGGFGLGQGFVVHDGACCGDCGGVVFGLADVDPEVELVVHGGHPFSSRWGRGEATRWSTRPHPRYKAPWWVVLLSVVRADQYRPR